MATFQYNADLLGHFPAVVGGVILAQNLHNGPTPPGLLEAYQAEQVVVIKRLGDTALSQLPSLSAWRGVFSSFGVEPTKYRNAAEALLRRLTKKGDIPSINLLVDLGNLISIRYALPVAVFDTREVEGALTVRFADGSERFTPLGEAIVENPEVGEVIFSDDKNMVLARRWCWRQSEESAAQPPTTSAIMTIEGHHSTARQDVESALADFTALLRQYTEAKFSSGVLDKDNLKITNNE